MTGTGARMQERPAVRRAARFERVSFRYNPDGQLGGMSGAGKSALAQLIPRLYWPQRGRVPIDDVVSADSAWDSAVSTLNSRSFGGGSWGPPQFRISVTVHVINAL